MRRVFGPVQKAVTHTRTSGRAEALSKKSLINTGYGLIVIKGGSRQRA
jgi:hypothetical protein